MERRPHGEFPVSGDFLGIFSRVLNKGAPPEASSTETLYREMPYLQSPVIQLSKSPVDQFSRFSKRGSYE
jgi:hypothetical protein